MARYTITPWRHHADLLAVRSQLYHLDATSSEDIRRHAVDRIMAWKLRSNLPHAVESTALLIDAQLHHTLNPSNSSFSVRAVYTAAFTRFVTGFCDIGRAREGRLGMEQSSMLEIARQIGMPEHFVALRHEATHEEMPSLRRLVGATEEALGWLWRVYWSRLEEPETVGVGVGGVKEEARKLFKAFRSARREAFRAKKQHSREHDEEFFGFCQAARVLCHGSKPKVDAIAEVLVNDRLLFPAKREFGSSMEGAFHIWDDILEDIYTAEESFVPALIRSLLTRLSEEKSINQEQDADTEACYLWLVHLMQYNQPNWHSTSPLVKNVLRGDTMKWCCLHPGHWTQRLGQQLLRSDDEYFRDDWEHLFDASMLQDGAGDAQLQMEVDGPGFLNDISRKRFMAEGDRRTGRDSSESLEVVGPWRRAPMSPRVPIGVVA